MKNNLIQKIGQGIFRVGVPLLFGGLSLINSGCNHKDTLKVGSSEVTYISNYTFKIDEDIIEKKFDGTEIIYNLEPGLCRTPYNFQFEGLKINGEE